MTMSKLMPNTAASSENEDGVAWLHVVAAVIRAPDDRILLAKRPADKHQGGKWEFPGGKVEAGELPVQALQRELHEELGIAVAENDCRPLIKVRYHYPEKAVLLDVWDVRAYQGDAFGKEGQEIAFFAADELNALEFPAANRPIVTAASLPDTYLITPEVAGGTDAFLTELTQALQRGVRLVQLRVKSLDAVQWHDLAPQAIALAHRYKAKILLNSPFAWLPDADGLHVTTSQLRGLSERPDYLEGKWLSAACHNEEELRLALQAGVDFVCLSPVQATTSHPDAPPLGWAAFAALADSVNVPVFALGGMQREDIPQVRESGGQGIAAISALWQQKQSAG